MTFSADVTGANPTASQKAVYKSKIEAADADVNSLDPDAGLAERKEESSTKL